MRRLFPLLSLILTLTSITTATIINVPDDQLTIQAGLNSATEGDTVLVAPGIYYENIVWPAVNGIKLIGSGEEECIIDGDLLGSVIRFEEDLGGMIDTTTTVAGLTIQHGYAQGSYPDYWGGGIFCRESSPCIADVTIIDNFASYGGGLFCTDYSSPILRNVTIRSNEALNYGGGINCWENCNPSLSSVSITDNTSSSGGGGISCRENCNPTFSDVTIMSNLSFEGGGLHCYYSNPSLSDVAITSNSADYGGGIHLFSSSPTLLDVTITGNSASDYGGGMYCMESSSPTLHNVIISNNAALNGGGIVCTSSHPSLSGVTVRENIALIMDGYGNGGGIYCWNSNPNMDDALIAGNHAEWAGGGIYCNQSSSPNLMNMTITNNSADEFGGGLYCEGSSSPTLLDVTLNSNFAISGGGIACRIESAPILSSVLVGDNSAGMYGGGIYISTSSTPVFMQVRISHNSANHGGGIYCHESSPSISSIVIEANSALHGGGISCSAGANPILENITAFGNIPELNGGGIYCSYQSSPALENCVFWENTPYEVCFSDEDIPNSITISCSDIQGGEEGIETNGNGTVYWLADNIDADPLFCDPENGDYRLQLDSPCRTDVCGFMGYTGETCEGEGVEDLVTTPTGSYLANAYPNPFNPSTTIEYGLATPSAVTLSVYNISGQLVVVIQDGFLPAGHYTATWHPSNLPSGVYLVELRTGALRDVMKVSYVK